MDDLYDEFAAAAGLSRRQLCIDYLGPALTVVEKWTKWAVAPVRQLEYLLKAEGNLQQALSVQEIINLSLGDDDGTFYLYPVVEALVNTGTVQNRLCPLTESLNSHRFYQETATRFRPSQVTVHCVFDYIQRHGPEFGRIIFHGRLRRELKLRATTMVFRALPNYSEFTGGELAAQRVYHPGDSFFQVVLGVDHGVDPSVGLYYEYEGTRGLSVGTQGYLKVLATLVSYFVEMRV